MSGARRKLVIDRSKWLRGRRSTLLVKGGCGCAIGLYLLACGMPPMALIDRTSPCHVGDLPAEASWLVSVGGTIESAPAYCLLEANDLIGLDDADRERVIARYFEARNVDVTFVDSVEEACS